MTDPDILVAEAPMLPESSSPAARPDAGVPHERAEQQLSSASDKHPAQGKTCSKMVNPPNADHAYGTRSASRRASPDASGVAELRPSNPSLSDSGPAHAALPLLLHHKGLRGRLAPKPQEEGSGAASRGAGQSEQPPLRLLSASTSNQAVQPKKRPRRVYSHRPVACHSTRRASRRADVDHDSSGAEMCHPPAILDQTVTSPSPSPSAAVTHGERQVAEGRRLQEEGCEAVVQGSAGQPDLLPLEPPTAAISNVLVVKKKRQRRVFRGPPDRQLRRRDDLDLAADDANAVETPRADEKVSEAPGTSAWIVQTAETPQTEHRILPLTSSEESDEACAARKQGQKRPRALDFLQTRAAARASGAGEADPASVDGALADAGVERKSEESLVSGAAVARSAICQDEVGPAAAPVSGGDILAVQATREAESDACGASWDDGFGRSGLLPGSPTCSEGIGNEPGAHLICSTKPHGGSISAAAVAAGALTRMATAEALPDEPDASCALTASEGIGNESGAHLVCSTKLRGGITSAAALAAAAFTRVATLGDLPDEPDASGAPSASAGIGNESGADLICSTKLHGGPISAAAVSAAAFTRVATAVAVPDDPDASGAVSADIDRDHVPLGQVDLSCAEGLGVEEERSMSCSPPSDIESCFEESSPSDESADFNGDERESQSRRLRTRATFRLHVHSYLPLQKVCSTADDGEDTSPLAFSFLLDSRPAAHTSLASVAAEEVQSASAAVEAPHASAGHSGRDAAGAEIAASSCGFRYMGSCGGRKRALLFRVSGGKTSGRAAADRTPVASEAVSSEEVTRQSACCPEPPGNGLHNAAPRRASFEESHEVAESCTSTAAPACAVEPPGSATTPPPRPHSLALPSERTVQPDAAATDQVDVVSFLMDALDDDPLVEQSRARSDQGAATAPTADRSNAEDDCVGSSLMQDLSLCPDIEAAVYALSATSAWSRQSDDGSHTSLCSTPNESPVASPTAPRMGEDEPAPEEPEHCLVLELAKLRPGQRFESAVADLLEAETDERIMQSLVHSSWLLGDGEDAT